MHNDIANMLIDMDLHCLAEATQEGYLRRTKIFLREVSKEPETINMEDIKKYILHLKNDKKLSLGTINAYISGIKFFYTISLRKDWDEKKVPRMRGYQSFPVVLSKEEVFEILDSVSNLKHRAVLSLMYGSGLRVSEVVKLKVCDIDSKNFQIKIRQSKNKSDRYAILPEYTLVLLREYWKQFNKPKDWLFCGANLNEHYHVKSVKNLVIKIRDRLQIQKKISAHTFRHAFATHLLEDDVQLVNIQHMMGHKSLSTTTRYLHMTSKTMMNIKSPIETYRRNQND